MRLEGWRRPGSSWFETRFALLTMRMRTLLPVRRQRGRAFAERALHHHGVEPAAELQADTGMRADHLEAGLGVDADRTGIGGIADHGDHLPEAARLAFTDQPQHQLQP